MNREMKDREMWFMLYDHYRLQGIPSYNLIFECISDKEAHLLCNLIRSYTPISILEIGSFVGMSTGIMAYASSETCKIHCVDPGFPTYYFTEISSEIHNLSTLEYLYEMLNTFNFKKKVTVTKGYSSQPPYGDYQKELINAGISLNEIPVIGEKLAMYGTYDLVFIDGDHNTQSVLSDLYLVSRCLSADGLIVLHDISGDWGPLVEAAIHKFIGVNPQFHLWKFDNIGCLSTNPIIPSCIDNTHNL